MSQVVQIPSNDLQKIEQVLIGGDLSVLTEGQRLSYYKKVCETLALNPLTKPFEFIKLNGKLVMYAVKACTDQLRSSRKVSVTIKARENIAGCYIVTAGARLPDGREDESTGAVNIDGLKGENLANAMMKAETKAKRRVTLSICGLGMLDESEVADIPQDNGLGIKADPPPADGSDGNVDPNARGYRIPFGKYAQRALEEIDLGQLRNYVNYIEGKAEREGKPLTGKVLEFVERANDYIAAFENGVTEEEDANL